MIFRRCVMAVATVVMSILFVGCHHNKPELFAGEEWLSWTPEHRAQFVYGFIEGHQLSASTICIKGQAMWLEERPKEASTSDFQQVCTSAAPAYTHSKTIWNDKQIVRIDVSSYVNPINVVYGHKECRAVPYSILMEHLNDAEYRDGEAFYEYLHHTPKMNGVYSNFPEDFYRCLGMK